MAVTAELYEKTYQRSNHFSFGRNWRDFLSSVTSERIALAERSLTDFLGRAYPIKNRSFVDIGCGSGLFSLAAYRLGAKQVISVDVDKHSLECAKRLRAAAGNPKNWRVIKGSAVDSKLVTQLGRHDIVYSWGVLHHSGDMDTAVANVARLVKPAGALYIAIYNHSASLTHGRSTFWLKVKRSYNSASGWQKGLYYQVYRTYLFFGLLLSGVNPIRYQRDYQSARGMSYRHDILDWLGGYPYQFARPVAIINQLGSLGFACQKLLERTGIGCNEYLFTRVKQ